MLTSTQFDADSIFLVDVERIRVFTALCARRGGQQAIQFTRCIFGADGQHESPFSNQHGLHTFHECLVVLVQWFDVLKSRQVTDGPAQRFGPAIL